MVNRHAGKVLSLMLAAALLCSVPYRTEAAYVDRSGDLPGLNSSSDILVPILAATGAVVGIVVTYFVIRHFTAKKHDDKHLAALRGETTGGRGGGSASARRAAAEGSASGANPYGDDTTESSSERKITVEPYLRLGLAPSPAESSGRGRTAGHAYWKVGFSVKY